MARPQVKTASGLTYTDYETIEIVDQLIREKVLDAMHLAGGVGPIRIDAGVVTLEMSFRLKPKDHIEDETDMGMRFHEV